MTFSTLVSVDDVETHLFDPAWCVVDCRHELSDFSAGAKAYREGHIPGAVFAGVEDQLSGPKTGRNGRHPLPEREALVALLRAWGVRNDTQLVAYDAHAGHFAARLWWLARWLGHVKVAVLDGGWPAWIAKTRWSSVTTLERNRAGTFVAGASLAATVGADGVLATRGTGRNLLVDARAPERYRGEMEPIDPIAGHIPGAVNRFWQDNTNNGRFKAAPALRAEFDALLQGRAANEVVHQCGSGVTACHHVLAMEIAGLPGSALYPGSWSEWIADPSRPIVTGANP
ncbi:MAG TPA: sulfurtransferase [Burkholderiaceae bacterium]|nr:sulfurtransferase [Burkholderiaceae bacterium]